MMSHPHRTAPGSLFALLLLTAALVTSCVPQEQEALTEPCTEDCNEMATIGSTCQQATDCAQGDACNLGVVNGYCQGSCEAEAAVGDVCNADMVGRCVARADGQGLACVVGCDPGAPSSCPRQETACYDVPGTEIGVCLPRCTADDQCGSGFGCDGQGICRTVGASCDGLTNSGCPSGQACYLSFEQASFCGLPGSKLTGQSCSRLSECVEGNWCVEGACRPLCAVDDFSACGNRPGVCTAVVRGFRLGYCRF